MDDLRNIDYVTITETYTKAGVHLSSVAKTSDGRVVWEEGRQRGRDVVILPTFEYAWKLWWNKESS